MTNDNSEILKIAGDNSDFERPEDGEQTIQYVTFVIGGQVFGLPIDRVHEVFSPENVTKVPLSHRAIMGVLNLRGRIVTAIDMRCLLGLPRASGEEPPFAVGIEKRGESYGLIVDTIGEVMTLSANSREPNPANLDESWRKVAAGIHRLEGQLLVLLDIDQVLASFTATQSAA